MIETVLFQNKFQNFNRTRTTSIIELEIEPFQFQFQFYNRMEKRMDRNVARSQMYAQDKHSRNLLS